MLSDIDESHNDEPVTIHSFDATISDEKYRLTIVKAQDDSYAYGRAIKYNAEPATESTTKDQPKYEELFTFHYDPKDLGKTPHFNSIRKEELNSSSSLRNAAIEFVKFADKLSKLTV